MLPSSKDCSPSKFRVVIHTCRHELFSSIISRYSFIKAGVPSESISILTIDDLPALKACDGKILTRNGSDHVYNINTPQSHLPIRFLVPEYLAHDGLALVIDPDVFCVSTIDNMCKPFESLSKDTPVIAREVRGGPFIHGHNSAVMYMDAAELTSWTANSFISRVFDDKSDLQGYIYLQEQSLFATNQSVGLLEPCYNSYDFLDKDTVLLHCTYQYTQPWKSGMDLYGKIIDHIQVVDHKKYRGHPSAEVESFVIELIRSAFRSGYFDFEFLINEIRLGNVSESLIELVH